MGRLVGRMGMAAALLVGLVIAVGYAAVLVLDAPVWFPIAFGIAVVLLQYLVSPWLIRWMVPATVIPIEDGAYATDEPIGALVAARCRDAGIPMVRLGIIDDGTPNAFAFGRTPRSAHVWVSRGLIERLDDDELDAVVCHELAHIRHWDMAIMTVAALVPMLLYMVHVVARRMNRAEARAVAVGAFVAYLVAQIGVLAVSRARELAADRWSCATTGHGDAMASALVKIAYGIGQVDAEHAQAQAGGDKQARREGFRHARMQSMRVLGIMSSHDGKEMAALLSGPGDTAAAMSGLRWDRTNPWARLLEKLSTHPLVATRIAALAASGLPGAPRRWAEALDLAEADERERAAAWRRFVPEAVVAYLPWALIVPALVAWYVAGTTAWLGWALLLGGALLFVKQRLRYPFGHRPVAPVTALLGRVDANPVQGIPVEVRGRVMGRGVPGYVLSPDLVVADDGGFVPLVYRNPIPFAHAWFALFRTENFLGREVVARGWYFRGPGPWIELRDVEAVGVPDARRARGVDWIARHLASSAIFTAGFAMVLTGIG